jgi:Zn-dependent protease with chaperone function
VTALTFLLECVAVVAATTLTASIALAMLFPLIEAACGRFEPAWRADAYLLLSLTPALLGLAVLMGVATPSVLAAFGLRDDHCLVHDHHRHLCFVHSAGAPWAVAAMGAIALALLGLRAARWLRREHVARRDLAALISLARPDGGRGVYWVPGDSALCLSTGLLEPRVVVSESLATSLSADELAAALAHERAHVRRKDPLCLFTSTLALLVSVPLLTRRLRPALLLATEQTADVHAVQIVGDPTTVASAIINVARLGLPRARLPQYVTSMAARAVELRVAALLSARSLRPQRAWGLRLGLLSTVAIAAIACVQAPRLHHAVETLLHSLF